MKKVVFILMLIGFGACKTNEAYKKPDLGSPNVFYGKDQEAGNGTNLNALSWKEFFKDSLLVSLIDSALIHNIDMQLADQYVEMGMARYEQSKKNFLPAVGSNLLRYRREMFSEEFNNYGSNRSRRKHGTDPPQTFYTEHLQYEAGAIGFTWELDVWGKFRSFKRATRLAYMKTEEFKKTVQTSLVADIAFAYSNLLLLKSQIEVYKRNLALNDNTLRIVKLQYEAGEVTSLAVKQTQSQRLKVQALIPQLEKQYVQQENRLNKLLGRFPQEIATQSSFEDEVLADEYVVGLPIELLNNRPDVAASEFALMESYERVGVANAMRYPSLNIGASLGLNAMNLDKVLNPVGAGFLLLNGALFQPVFMNRKLKTNYELALAEKNVAELKFRQSFLQAVNEVSDALVSVEKLKEEHFIAQERVDAAHKSVKDASFLFKSGLANYLEVITAQSEVLDSELNLERIKQRILVANVELYRSLGGGWK